jgi:ABC-type glycerol-3-phosphate transport system substrate-binding protein
MNRAMKGLFACAALALAVGIGSAAKAEDITLTVWSHEADEPAKVALREQAARNFEAKHPGVHVKITWYEKDGLYTALKTACRRATSSTRDSSSIW